MRKKTEADGSRDDLTVPCQSDTGWWFLQPLWKMMDFVSWDDEIPNWMESHEKFHGSSHHQPEYIYIYRTNIAMENHHFKWVNQRTTNQELFQPLFESPVSSIDRHISDAKILMMKIPIARLSDTFWLWLT